MSANFYVMSYLFLCDITFVFSGTSFFLYVKQSEQILAHCKTDR